MFAKSLDRKILIVLSLSVAIITALIIYFTNKRLTRGIFEEFSNDSRETMSVIAAGIRQAMASGNSGFIENQLLDIKSENNDLELHISDTEQKIIFSSEVRSLGRHLRDEVGNAAMLEKLKAGVRSGILADTIYEEERGGKRYFMHAHLMNNHPQCYRCHGSDKKVLGTVLLRKNIGRNYAALSELTTGNIVISLIGVLAVIFVCHVLITRLVSKPVKELAREIAELPDRISDNSMIGGAEIRRDDEIGALQKSFHDMAVDIYEKNHALAKMNADLANANRELESFAYSVSHDLRAPLRNIDGFSKILMDDFAGSLPEKAQHYLRRVRNGTARMSMLIDDILMFSKIGRADLNFRKVPAAVMVKSVLENFTEEIERRGIAVTIGDLPEINCDQVLMQSLFSNLISNAVKYTRNTPNPAVEVGYDRQKRIIFVRDNGVGFDMQYHDKIFQIFQRLHLPEEYEGTGIGLAIVKRIIERHHGRIWAESEQGKGTTFYMDIPTF